MTKIMRFGWGILGILCCGLRESDFSLIDFFNRESEFFSMRKRIIFLRESDFFSHPSWLRKKNRLVVNAFAPLGVNHDIHTMSIVSLCRWAVNVVGDW